MSLYQFFDRIAVIHLPERKDRFDSLSRELRTMGVSFGQPKVHVPPAPRPANPDGFPSRGVYGNFLSHLSILQQALNDGLENIWVLEDDAIFSRRMCRNQSAIVDCLRNSSWDICFFGHSLTRRQLAGAPMGLVAPTEDFIWAHCYAVHSRVLPRLVSYLQQALVLPAGHPQGGRLYIDAAFTLFRHFNPEVVTLVSNPPISVQKGGPSSLGQRNWYDNVALTRPFISVARSMRDHWWRLSA